MALISIYPTDCSSALSRILVMQHADLPMYDESKSKSPSGERQHGRHSADPGKFVTVTDRERQEAPTNKLFLNRSFIPVDYCQIKCYRAVQFETILSVSVG